MKKLLLTLVLIMSFSTMIAQGVEVIELGELEGEGDDDGTTVCNTITVPGHWGWQPMGLISIPWYYESYTYQVCN